jgi:hypothetical protein
MPNYPSRANHVNKMRPYKQNSRAHASFSIAVCQQGETMLIIAATTMTESETSQHHLFFLTTKHPSFFTTPLSQRQQWQAILQRKYHVLGLMPQLPACFSKRNPKTFPKT